MTIRTNNTGIATACSHLFLGWFLLITPVLSFALDTLGAQQSGCAQITNMAFVEDTSGRFLLSDLVEANATPRWQSIDPAAVRFGYSQSSYWLRLQLSGQSSAAECVLLVDNAIINYLDFYQVNQHGDIVQQFHTGNKTVFSTRAIDHRKFLFPIQSPVNQKNTLYLKVSSKSRLTIPVTIWAVQDYFQADQAHLLWLGVFIGCMLIIVLSNAAIYFMVKDVTYLYYIIYVVLASLSTTEYLGLNFQYLWPKLPLVNGTVQLGFINILMIFLWTYILSFIGHRETLRKTNQYLLVLRCLYLANAVAAMYFSYHAVLVVSFVLIVIGSGIGFILGLPLLKQGDSSVRLIVIAFAGYFISFVVLAFSTLGWLPDLVIFKYSIMVGLMFQVTFFSLAFGDRIKQANKKAQTAQQQVLENQRLDNASLEARVQERTLLLDKANQKLLELSSTDGLTQVKNRGYFNGILVHEFKTAQRNYTSLAVVLIDLDDFKKINDSHGHLVGDDVLVATAKAVKALLHRPDDQLCRYGGEEFVVLLPNTDGVGAVAVAKRICAAIARLRIPVSDAELSLTASIGVAYGVPKRAETPLVLVEQADQALYRAKDLGKNRVIEYGDLPQAG